MASSELNLDVVYDFTPDPKKVKAMLEVFLALHVWRASDRIRMGRPVHGVLTFEEEELIRRLDAWVG